MGWTYFLMWHAIPSEEMDEKFASGEEADTLTAAQRIANESDRAVDVLRVREGIVESQPYRTIYPKSGSSG